MVNPQQASSPLQHREPGAATDLISNSVFYISIGINDYIHYADSNVSNVQNLYLPWSFNQFLASSVRKEIMVTLPLLLVFSFCVY